MINVNVKHLNKIAEGGEANIYEYDQDTVIKEFNSKVDINEKKRKVKKLLSLDLPKEIIGPTDAVTNTNGKFIGYAMPKIEGEELKKLCSKKYLKANGIKIKDVSGMLVKILDAIKALHANNIIIGDLNECNILFDNKFNIYLIDVDSWSIGDDKCTVIMESFKDPKMKNGEFTEETDWYAFAVLTFKVLTMLHPFGGTMDPDVNILDRMKMGASVIDNKNVKIPKPLCKGWNFMSPDLIKDLKDIFTGKSRKCIESSLKDFNDNLMLCSQHKDYYYERFSKCPLCDKSATLIKDVIKKTNIKKPVAVQGVSNIPYSTIFKNNNIKLMLNKDVYIDNSDLIRFRSLSATVPFNPKVRYYAHEKNIVICNSNQIAINNGQDTIKFEKAINSKIRVREDGIYFINKNSDLSRLIVGENGNNVQSITTVSYNNVYEVYDKEHYFIVNSYSDKSIINVDGFNHEVSISKIEEYGIHYDTATGSWLLMTINDKGKFNTLVFKKDKLLYSTDKIKVNCELENLCFYNNTIYIPKTRKIRGFNYKKNQYKDFACNLLSVDSKLEKAKAGFDVIKDNGVYKVG